MSPPSPGVPPAVELGFREIGGEGRPIVLLHGLFGSSQNLSGVGRRLTPYGRVFSLDLRNHGGSPHTETHSLSDCVADVAGWAARHAGGPIGLLGHSMGGLVAMAFAIEHPRLTERLLVEDIAPRPYPLDHESEFRALATDISGCATRSELDALLAPLVPDAMVRGFLLANAVRDGRGFRWRLGLAALRSSTLLGDFGRLKGSYGGPCLFLAGDRSASVRDADRASITSFFPHARVEVMPGDHWLHVSAPGEFLPRVEEFFRNSGGPV
jgi:esterase